MSECFMNAICRWMCAVALGAAPMAAAQDERDPSKIGFVRFMSVVSPGEGNTFFEVDGKSLWKKGYKLGQRTGGIGMEQGAHEFVVKKTGCNPAKRKIDIAAGQTQTLVAYAEADLDDLGEIIGWNLRLARLGQNTPESGFWVTLISFCREKELPLEVFEGMSEKTIKAAVPRLKAKRFQIGSGEVRAIVSHKGERLLTLKAQDRGNYVVMVFENEKGEKEALSFFDPKFIIAN
ncbi:MAG: hypothetical protein HKN82_03110 [Akkermansiaceae bacterium]|nr:hypothetical protein [Akkermansiaceae bacterium]